MSATKTVISIEVAEAEVKRWLDFKQIGQAKRKKYQDSIDSLAESIEEGTLVLKDDNTWEQTLKVPLETIGDDKQKSVISKMNYKSRVKIDAIRTQLASMKNNDDMMALTMAYMAAITGTPKAVLKELDTVDYSTGSAIVVFFL